MKTRREVAEAMGLRCVRWPENICEGIDNAGCTCIPPEPKPPEDAKPPLEIGSV